MQGIRNEKKQPFRVAHLNFSVERSVDRKLEQEAVVASRMGLPLDFILFSPSVESRSIPNLKKYQLHADGLGRSVAPKIQWLFRLFWAAHSCVWDGYDGVVLRYPKLPVGWAHFIRRVGRPLITEHHTDEIAELRGDGGLVRRCAGVLEKRLQRRFLRRVDGVIGVTPEITDRVRSLAPQAKAIVISNGVDVQETPFTGFTPFDGKTLRLVSVASRFFGWHGMERLMDGLDRYRGPVQVEVTLLGEVPDMLCRRIAHTSGKGICIRCPGALYGPEKNEWMARANLAVASLALYKNGMKQASTLKAREYAARGLPFIYGYDDPDIPDDCVFALRMENNETPVDLNRLIHFAEQLGGRSDLAERIREYAKETMDWSHKVRAMYEFARDVAASVRSGSG